MDINLLLSIIMRVQGCNRLIHYLNSPLLRSLHKIIINLRVSSVSLHPLKHRRWGQLFAGLEFLVPVSLVFLVNSEDRGCFPKTETLLDYWFWAVCLRSPVLGFESGFPKQYGVCFEDPVEVLLKSWSEQGADLIDKSHEGVRVGGVDPRALKGVETRAVAGLIDKEAKLVTGNLVVYSFKGFELDVKEVSSGLAVWGDGVELRQADVLNAFDQFEGVELDLLLLVMDGSDWDILIFLGRSSDLIDVFLDFLLHYFVVFLKLLSSLLQFGVLIFLLLLLCYLEYLALHILCNLCRHRSLADWSLLICLLGHYLQDWGLVENLLEPSEVSLCCSFIVLILSHENAVIRGQVERAKGGELMKTSALVLEIIVSKETCVHVFEQYFAKFVHLLANNKAKLDALACLVHYGNFYACPECWSFNLFSIFCLWLLWIHLIYGLV